MGSNKDHTRIPLDDFHKDWHSIFKRFGPDSKGEIELGYMRNLLNNPELQQEFTPDEVQNILNKVDKDQNGKLTYIEFMELVRGNKLLGIDKISIKRYFFRAATFAVVPKNQRDAVDGMYEDEHNCRPPPIFMLIISLVELAIFIYHTVYIIQEKGWIGINGPAPIDSVLIYDPYRRYEAWRFLTYMFVHAGFMHIVFNILVQLFLGIPLELVHKWYRVLPVYFAGVIAGSLGTSITDPDTFLCGASGGVYALMFAHLASLVLNWKEMEFAWVRLLFLAVLTSTDVGVAIYYRYVKLEDTNVGYVAHLAGAIAGLLVGISALRNLKIHQWEKVVWWIALAIYIALMIAAVLFNIFNTSHFLPPRYTVTKNPM